jgi:DNA-binding MarR family transcriptional regulator
MAKTILKEQSKRIFEAVDTIERSMEKNMMGAELDLTKPQLRTLLSVARHDYCTMSELSKDTGYPTSALTGIIDRMIKKKLVKRLRDESDRRIVKVTSTPIGAGLASELYKRILRTISTILGKVDQVDRERIILLVEKIAGSFARSNNLKYRAIE